MSKADENAFPTQMWDEELKEATWLDGGLTKRELFTMAAMQGLCANPSAIALTEDNCIAVMVEIENMAYGIADATLARLERGRE